MRGPAGVMKANNAGRIHQHIAAQLAIVRSRLFDVTWIMSYLSDVNSPDARFSNIIRSRSYELWSLGLANLRASHLRKNNRT